MRVPRVEPMKDTSDAELASAVTLGGADGNSAAEAELCRRFGRRVRLYGRRRLQDSAVDDLVQRVMLIVLAKLRAGQVDAPARIDSFVLGTARFVTRELSRAGGRDVPLEDQTMPVSLAETRSDPLALQSLSACLESLAARERSVVALTFFHDQDATEIGIALGMEPGHVRIARYRAIARLRTCMGLGSEEVVA